MAIDESLNDLQLDYLDVYLVSYIYRPVQFSMLLAQLWFLNLQWPSSLQLASIHSKLLLCISLVVFVNMILLH